MSKHFPPNNSIKKSGTAGINLFQYPPLMPVTLGYDCIHTLLGLEERVEPEEPFVLYISIPFCRKRCNSCVLFKEFLPKNQPDKHLGNYVDALLTELQFYTTKIRFMKRNCAAIYFGGGTASVLPSNLLKRLLVALKKGFRISPNAEITLEGNPKDFVYSYLSDVKSLGIPRISIGLQSLSQKTLSTLGCSHTSADSQECLKTMEKVKFKSYNIDLIYGVPGQTLQESLSDLLGILEYGPPSITLHDYQVHSGSATERMIKEQRLPALPDKYITHGSYLELKRQLIARGFVEGRKGSFALPGHRQIYGRLAYDQCSEFLGLGAGAYGFINGYQVANAVRVHEYHSIISSDRLPPIQFLSRKTDDSDKKIRYILFNLSSGLVSLEKYEIRFGENLHAYFGPWLVEQLRKQWISYENSYLRVTELGSQNQKELLESLFAIRCEESKSTRMCESESRCLVDFLPLKCVSVGYPIRPPVYPALNCNIKVKRKYWRRDSENNLARLMPSSMMAPIKLKVGRRSRDAL